MRLVLALALAYLAGSFPTAYLIGRTRRVDIGALGSGNYGATNVFRALGAGPAALALTGDGLKGLLPVLLLPRVLPVPELAPATYGILLAVAAVVGHVFSLFLGFRGGKGIGTTLGAYLAIAPWAVLAAAIAWAVVVAATRVVSLASLLGAIALLVGVIVTDFGPQASDVVLGAVTTALVAFVFWTHRANIARLAHGQERRIARARSGSEP